MENVFLGVACCDDVAHALMPVVLVHHSIEVAAPVAYVAVVVDADGKHVAHGE